MAFNIIAFIGRSYFLTLSLGFVSFLLISLASTILSNLIISKYQFIKKEKKKHPLPPGPKPWPVVGCLVQLVRNRPTPSWIHRMMQEMNTEIACIRLGSIHVVSVTSPELGCEFFKKHDAVFSSRPPCTTACLASNGYLTSAFTTREDQWKKMRRLISQEVMSGARLRWFHDKRLQESNSLVSYILNQCKTSNCPSGNLGVVNVRSLARHYCANVMKRMIFSRRYFTEEKPDGGPSDEENDYVEALMTILSCFYAFDVSDYMPYGLGFLADKLSEHQKIVKNGLAVANKFHDPAIDERIQMWRDGFKNQKEDILDVFISLKDEEGKAVLTKEEIRAQIMELMVAVVDNPSNAVEWALAEMLRQPELIQRALEELDNVVGQDRLVQESDLPRLNYITACAKEAFRLHPVTYFTLPRVASTDTIVGGYFIPKGSHVILSRPGFGRNGRVWEEPLRFNPERHLGGGSKVVLTDMELRMISFSAGKRACPGVTLGSAITCMLLSRLLQGFSWSMPHNNSGLPANEGITRPEFHPFLPSPLLAVAKPRLASNVYAANL